jgi:hypothetical protein
MGRRFGVAAVVTMTVLGGSWWATLRADKTPVHLCHYSKGTGTYEDILVDDDSTHLKGHVNHINVGGPGDCRLSPASAGDPLFQFPPCKAACNASPNGH